LCTKAYKYVILLYDCVILGEKNMHEHILLINEENERIKKLAKEDHRQYNE